METAIEVVRKALMYGDEATHCTRPDGCLMHLQAEYLHVLIFKYASEDGDVCAADLGTAGARETWKGAHKGRE